MLASRYVRCEVVLMVGYSQESLPALIRASAGSPRSEMLVRQPGTGCDRNGDNRSCLGGVHFERAQDSAPPRNHHQIPLPMTTASTVAMAAAIIGQRRRGFVTWTGGDGDGMYIASVLFVFVSRGEDFSLFGERCLHRWQAKIALEVAVDGHPIHACA